MLTRDEHSKLFSWSVIDKQRLFRDFVTDASDQGILTKGDESVQVTSSLGLLVLHKG